MMKKKDHMDDRSKPVEQEVLELQRKFRVLENDKKAFSEDSATIVRKQRSAIEKFGRENRSMKSELAEVRRSDHNNPEARRSAETLARIAESKETLERSIAAQFEIKLKIDEKMDITDARTMQLREELGAKGGVGATRDSAQAVAKQIRVLENRLDKSLQNFNQTVAQNRNLRQKIDSLRRERVVFDQIYSKLERDFDAKKREMASIIEAASSAYEARDSAQAQMTSLKTQADREHAEFEKEWRELGRLIENDKKMKEFMRQKERNRALEGQQNEKQNQQSGELTGDDEDKMKKRVTKNAWAIARGKVQLSGLAERIRIYEEAFARIQAATGLSDIDDLVCNFSNAEETNFSLFNYCNLLSSQIESLEQAIADLRSEQELLKGGGTDGATGTVSEAAGGSKSVAAAGGESASKSLDSLEEKWNKYDKRAEYYDLKYQQAAKVLSSTRAGLQSIYNRLGCNVVGEGLKGGAAIGLSDHVTEGNMLSYLGVIEQRTNEILLLHSALQEGDEDNFANDDGIAGQREPMSQLQIKLPSTVEDYTDDEEDEEDDDTRPFTREELKLKTQRGLQRKQEKNLRKGHR